MEEINIEKLMEEIRIEIKEKGYKEDVLPFRDVIIPLNSQVTNDNYNEEELKQNLREINVNWQLAYYRPLYGNKVVVFVKRIIRKLVKFLIYPMLEQQREWNANVTRTLNQIIKILPNLNIPNDRLGDIEILKSSYIELVEREKQLEKENKDLCEKLEIMDKKIEILELQLKK